MSFDPNVPRPTVLLADDHMEILRAFKRLLQPSYEVVGCVADGLELLEQARCLKPDVIVLDHNMPRLSGLAACAQMRQASPLSKVIVVSAAMDDELGQRALSMGAAAFVLKERAAEELCSVIQACLEEPGQRKGSRSTPDIA